MPSAGNITPLPPAETSARLFAALGDETRLRLVSRLCEGPHSLTALSASFSVTRQAISKHLRVMEEAGLVRMVRSGRESLWQLTPDALDDAQRYLEHVSHRWDLALERLREHLAANESALNESEQSTSSE